jgi:hypothetical protein
MKMMMTQRQQQLRSRALTSRSSKQVVLTMVAMDPTWALELRPPLLVVAVKAWRPLMRVRGWQLLARIRRAVSRTLSAPLPQQPAKPLATSLEMATSAAHQQQLPKPLGSSSMRVETAVMRHRPGPVERMGMEKQGKAPVRVWVLRRHQRLVLLPAPLRMMWGQQEQVQVQ